MLKIVDESKGIVELHNLVIKKIAEKIKPELIKSLEENGKTYKEGDSEKFTRYIINTFNSSVNDCLENGISVRIHNMGALRCSRAEKSK